MSNEAEQVPFTISAKVAENCRRSAGQLGTQPDFKVSRLIRYKKKKNLSLNGEGENDNNDVC